MFQKIKFYFKPKTKKHFIFKLFTLQQIYFNTQKQNHKTNSSFIKLIN